MNLEDYKSVVDPQVLNSYRHILQAYGAFMGLKVFTIEAQSLMPNWKKDKQERKNVLMHELKVYVAKSIDVTSVELIAIGDDLFVQLNKDIKMRFPVREPNYKSPSHEVVKAAIEALELGEDEPYYFTEYEGLQQHLESYNMSVKKFCKYTAELMMKAEGAVESIIKYERAGVEDYKKHTENITFPSEKCFRQAPKKQEEVTVDINVRVD